MDLLTQINYAERHNNFNPEILTAITRQEATNPAIVLSLSSTEAKKLWKYAEEVINEIVNCVAFIKLKTNKEGIYSYISPVHQVEDLIAQKIKELFSEQKIIIYSVRGKFTC